MRTIRLSMAFAYIMWVLSVALAAQFLGRSTIRQKLNVFILSDRQYHWSSVVNQCKHDVITDCWRRSSSRCYRLDAARAMLCVVVCKNFRESRNQKGERDDDDVNMQLLAQSPQPRPANARTHSHYNVHVLKSFGNTTRYRRKLTAEWSSLY
jgi:Fe2+ transport system protein B